MSTNREKSKLENIKEYLSRLSVLKIEKEYQTLVLRYPGIEGNWRSANNISFKEMSFEELIGSILSMDKKYILVRETHDSKVKYPPAYIFNLKRFHKFEFSHAYNSYRGHYGFYLSFNNNISNIPGVKTTAYRKVEFFSIDLDRIESIVPVLEGLEKYFPDEEFTAEFRSVYEELRIPSLAKIIKNRNKQEKTVRGYKKSLKKQKHYEDQLKNIFSNLSVDFQKEIMEKVKKEITATSTGDRRLEYEEYIENVYMQKENSV